MSALSMADRQNLEKLFEMSSGYVLNFSDRAFGEFVFESVGADIHSGQYSAGGISKAKKLRMFWKIEPDHVVGKLLLALIEYQTTLRVSPTEEASALSDKCRAVAIKLIQHPPRGFDHQLKRTAFPVAVDFVIERENDVEHETERRNFRVKNFNPA